MSLEITQQITMDLVRMQWDKELQLRTQPLLATNSSSQLQATEQSLSRLNEDRTKCLSSFQLK
jgi:hypothetical protein